MDSCRENYVRSMTRILFVGVLLALCYEEMAVAMRPLEGERWLKQNLVIQYLQRGPVAPSRSSPCTNIPGRGNPGRCTLAEMNVARHVATKVAPPVYPHVVVDFAAATDVAN